MGVELLTERHKEKIAGILSCYDRLVVQGTVPAWGYASGRTDYFYKHQMRIFDYPKWAEPLRDCLRANTERIAAEKWNRDRVRAQQEELPERRPGENGSGETR